MATESIPPTSRICKNCKREFPLTSEFFHNDPKGKLGLTQTCKDCARARAKAWSESNRERSRASARDYATRTRTPGSRKGEYEAQQRQQYFKAYYEKNAETLKEYQRDYIAANPEIVRERKRLAHIDNRESDNAKNRAWAAANPERVRANKAAYYQKNAEAIKKNQREYRATHLEQISDSNHYGHQKRKAVRNARNRAWKAAHREQVRANSANRKARMRNAPGKIIAADVHAQLAAQHETCFYCPASLAHNYTVDHYIPLAKDGTNYPSNIVMACHPCNDAKGDKWPQDFIAALARRAAKN